MPVDEAMNEDERGSRASERDDPLPVLSIWLLVALWPLLPGPAGAAAGALLVAATAWALWRGQGEVAAAGGFFVVFGAAAVAIGAGSQVAFAVALALYALVLWRAPRLRPAAAWWVRGRLTPPVLALIGAFAALSGAALVVWYVALTPDVSDLLERFVPPGFSKSAILAGGVAFAAVNALVEELAYRGVLTAALAGRGFAPATVIALQAVAFGTLHVHGFPRGALGVLLSIVYGAMMGALRQASGGMLAPWLAHLATDLVIIAIVVALAL